MAEPARLEIRVEDNGVGIEDGARERLQAMLDRTANPLEPGGGSGGHIGLLNIVSRLRLFFGEQVQMKLEAREPHGLRVILTIPLRDREETEDESVNRG
jgi:two-component system sensor histidine kinase YesM